MARWPGWTLALVVGMPCVVGGQETPPVPEPGTPGAGAPSGLERRLQDLERLNRRLAEQLEASERRHREEMEQLRREIGTLRGEGGAPSAGGDAGSADRPAESSVEARREEGVPEDAPLPREPRGEVKIPLKADFGPGFEIISDDGEHQLQIHQETQLDYRAFDPNGEEFARSGFVFPRVRLFFNGRVTKNWEYMFSINRGFGALDVLDAFVNYHPSDQFQIKAGRFMTPFNYEQFAVQNMWLITPERSLFTSNLGLNRQLGVQAWGQLLDKRLDYAVGVFDGPRNSYEDFNDAKDVFAYMNVRPFQDWDDSPLEFLNIGGSFVYGAQDNPLVPASWRTAANASNAGTADRYAPPFYAFNDDVVERGQRAFWSANVAYFYKRLSVLADYNGGILRYAQADAPRSFVIPAHGASVAAGFFLTGEEVERRTIVEPLRPFSLRRGDFGLGALELVARYSALNFDRDILSPELTDPTQWSHRAWVTNLGMNWYLNRYVKIYLDWQHSEFGVPVFYAPPDKKALTNELFWFRLQFYF